MKRSSSSCFPSKRRVPSCKAGIERVLMPQFVHFYFCLDVGEGGDVCSKQPSWLVGEFVNLECESSGRFTSIRNMLCSRMIFASAVQEIFLFACELFAQTKAPPVCKSLQYPWKPRPGESRLLPPAPPQLIVKVCVCPSDTVCVDSELST